MTPGSRPRPRGKFDDQNRLWFAEYGSNGVGLLDPKSGKIEEWVLPTPWSAPYHVTPDKNGEVWIGSMWDGSRDAAESQDESIYGLPAAAGNEHSPRIYR